VNGRKKGDEVEEKQCRTACGVMIQLVEIEQGTFIQLYAGLWMALEDCVGHGRGLSLLSVVLTYVF